MTDVAEAKAEYQQQTFDAFDDDPTPPLVGAAVDYFTDLAGAEFTDGAGEVWALWGLAPHDITWTGWACASAVDRDRGWLDQLEHVWLSQNDQLHHALVHVPARQVLRHRPYVDAAAARNAALAALQAQHEAAPNVPPTPLRSTP